MNDAPSQNQDKFIVRLPDGMRDRIKASAEANKRSMNAEFVHALEHYLLRPRPRFDGNDTGPPLQPIDYEDSAEGGFDSMDEEAMIERSMKAIEDDLRAFMAKAKATKQAAQD